MSEDNVEIVRRIYSEGLIDRDPKRLVDHFAAPDVEDVDPPDDVDPRRRRGRTKVFLARRRPGQFFFESEHELGELFDGGAPVVPAVSLHAKASAGASSRSS